MSDAVVVLIPAYRPGRALLGVIGSLAGSAIAGIIVVDDGSGPEYCPIFDEAARIPGVSLVRHAVNLGKGAALKTGMNHALCEFPGCAGVVTADADGQHHPEDILRVAAELSRHSDCLILGARQFDTADVPLRSRAGNTAARFAFRILVGQALQDTQTGLRGIPHALIPDLLRTTSCGYDFELDMLIRARHNGWPVREILIKTIYEPGNPTSHFNPLFDSLKAYIVLMRFSAVSLLTALLDNLVFYLVYTQVGSVAVSQAAARSVAIAFQYTASRKAVFFARGRHRLLFPKFLMLAAAHGLTSYFMIRGLLAAGVILLIAKPLAEGLLFVVSFVLQRDFVFKRSDATPAESEQAAHRLATIYGWAALVMAVALTIWGVLHYHLFAQQLWEPGGLIRLRHLSAAYGVWSLAFLMLRPAWFAPATLLGALGFLTIAIGPAAVAAIVLLLFSCYVTGALLLPDREPESSARASLAAKLLRLPVGASIWMTVVWVMVHFPVNYPAVYAIALLVPAAIRPRVTLACLSDVVTLFRPVRFERRLSYFALALAVFPLVCHFLVTFKPEMGADALAVHLAVPAWVRWQHFFPFDFRHLSWALMPLGADWCYTAVYQLGGEFAARFLNFSFLVLLTALIYAACRPNIGQGASLLFAGLFASTPMVQLVTGSLFAENLWAVLLFGALLAVVLFHETAAPRWLYTASLLLGAGMATKFGTIAFLLPLAAFAAWEVRKHRARLAHAGRVALVSAVLLIAAGAPTYVYAWAKSGNPLFPFMNNVFKSPWFDSVEAFVDHRYHLPLSAATVLDAVFQSHNYLESHDGALGFAYPFLALLGLLALSRRSAYAGRLAFAVAAVFSIATFNALAYLRYLYPALPLLILAGAVALARFRGAAFYSSGTGLLACHPDVPLRVRDTPGGLSYYHAACAALVAAFALNVYFLPASTWYHGNFYLNPLKQADVEKHYEQAAPVRRIVEYLNEKHPGEPVALFDSTDIAGLHAKAYTLSWHNHLYSRRAWTSWTPKAYGLLARELGVRLFVAPAADSGRTMPPPPITAFLEGATTRELRYGHFELRRMKPDTDVARWITGQAEVTAAPCDPAMVDDASPAVRFTGPWRRLTAFGETCRGTLAYTDQPGAEVTFRFTGTQVDYVCTKAFTRGLAEVLIDGVSRGTLDLYSPMIEWRSRFTFGGLAPGPHTITLRVLGRKSQESKGTDIDVDGFVVSPPTPPAAR